MKNVFVNVEERFVLEKKKIHKVITLLCRELKLNLVGLEINFVSSETIVAVNRKFLKHNYSTDIITFDYSTERNNLDVEIFISLPDAIKNSILFRVSVDNELLRLVVHGILHLIGYNDTNKGERKAMKKEEDRLVKKFQSYSKGIVK